MAKRKRLSPAQNSYLSGAPENKSTLGGPMAPPAAAAPIAQVASQASSQAALQELSDVLYNARAKGLLVEEIALGDIDEGHLVRDRLHQDEDEMEALMSSLRARGQQTPIEVVPLSGRADGKSWGLISGWRRLSALRRLYSEGSDPKFARVKALVIQPDSAEEAYIAMVEENEIRVNLSHYERARITVRALKEGVFPTQKKALQGLFANAPRAKRSKIGSFVTLVEALDAVLYFPAAISEKLGLALVRRINENAGFVVEVVAQLQAADRPDATAELALLHTSLEGRDIGEDDPVTDLETKPSGIDPEQAALRPGAVQPRIRRGTEIAAGERVTEQVSPGLRLGYQQDQQRIEINGSAVDADLLEDLKLWLCQRSKSRI